MSDILTAQQLASNVLQYVNDPEVCASLSRILHLENEIADEKRSAKEVIARFFALSVKQLFVQYPQMKSFGWSQNVQWNDEEDHFYAHIDTNDIEINGVDYEYTYHYEHLPSGKFGNLIYPEYRDIHPLYEVISDFMQGVGEDNLLAMFGDDAEVTITDKGAELSRF